MAIPKRLRMLRGDRMRGGLDLLYDVCGVCYKRSSMSALGISQRGMAERPIFSFNQVIN